MFWIKNVFLKNRPVYPCKPQFIKVGYEVGGGGKHCADMFPDVAILLQVFQIRFLPCSFVLWFIVPVNKFSLVSR